MSNVEIIRNIKKDCESSDHHVLCPKTFACIAKDFLCDGDNGNFGICHSNWLQPMNMYTDDIFSHRWIDCGDFSDETHCGAKVKCEEDQFECDNGLCIQHQWVCDGEYNSIEFDFLQNSLLFNSIISFCLGDNDCQDYSDEVNCTAKLS